MKIFHKKSDIYEFTIHNKKNGYTIGLVPTMGALHKGHQYLIKQSKLHTDITIVSIFVNPTQFGPQEDYNKYPRNINKDKKLLESEKVDALFYPNVNEIYNDIKNNSFVEVPILSSKLCGFFRPAHFKGVTTIVSKLFNIIPADYAFFGEKDWQQQTIIKKMVQDLDFPIKIKSCPTQREKDGLAISSRNKYLDPNSRIYARNIYRALKKAQENYNKNEYSCKIIKEKMEEILLNRQKSKEGLDISIQYLEICDSASLEPLKKLKKGSLVALAIFINKVRLIDNWIVGQPL